LFFYVRFYDSAGQLGTGRIFLPARRVLAYFRATRADLPRVASEVARGNQPLENRRVPEHSTVPSKAIPPDGFYYERF
jgi:hypothetical protein